MHAVPYDSRDQFIYERDLLLSFEGRDGTLRDREPAPRAGRPDAPGRHARARALTSALGAPEDLLGIDARGGFVRFGPRRRGTDAHIRFGKRRRERLAR